MARPFQFIVPTTPKVKARPRTGRGGHHYTPKATAAYEQAVNEAFIEAGGNRFDGPLMVEIELFSDLAVVRVEQVEVIEPTKLRGDVDNYAKSILDGMQLNDSGFDDGNVVALHIWKGLIG